MLQIQLYISDTIRYMVLNVRNMVYRVPSEDIRPNPCLRQATTTTRSVMRPNVQSYCSVRFHMKSNLITQYKVILGISDRYFSSVCLGHVSHAIKREKKTIKHKNRKLHKYDKQVKIKFGNKIRTRNRESKRDRKRRLGK